MSRYTGPKLRVVRRLGVLPGLTNKVPKQNTRPGQHGAAPHKKSPYGVALEEKQKIRFNYGLTERQLRRYHDIAKKNKEATGDVLLRICEMRLDSVVYRLGLAPSIPAARQLVRHGHIQVNGRRVNIPSFQCATGQKIVPSTKSVELVKDNLTKRQTITVPAHLSFNKDTLQGEVVAHCAPEDVMLKINSRLVVEFYNK